ncbi:Holliday junction branch migration protein RuvA [Thermosyntropha sp.]|uniref:Holliday junction branch migration protein RuvA n=1 Tax=Thermosyntropha sp. TaxID=2740820 RepID=UPI0025FF03D0|nr:Holliday junction branch migration protein RuvA [Thermosyntropha sp.]MBO8159934.1 Holliday junction branch migration protein RuvA [Thermosyntropha sp.]
MISFIRGILFSYEPEAVIIDVGGIGWTVYVHNRSFLEMPEKGQEIFLYTHLQVMENEFRLYGFLHREELELFKKLLAVSGLGAKSALGILGAMEPETFYQAVIDEKEKLLTGIPGIGKKTAQRLIFELKDKLMESYSCVAANTGVQTGELLEALESLGYKRSEVYPVIKEIQKEGKLTGGLEDNLKLVLRFLSGAKFK